jgi:biopolymer transport protein TolR
MAFSIGDSNGSGRGRRRFGGGNGTMSEINIVPLVDVVLVLLIIFMLTAQAMEFGLEIEVPQVKQVVDTAEDHPVIQISRSAKLFLNGTPININQIPDELAKKFKNAKTVYVEADKATVWDPIAHVMSELKDAKIGIQVVVKPLDSSPKE